MTRRTYSGVAPATTLSGAINNSTLTIPLTSGTGYPTGGASGPFFIVIDRGLSSEEKILCDSRSTDTITANASGRGYASEGTSAASHAAGAVVEHCFTKVDADEANAHINTTTDDNHTQYTLVAGTRAFTGVTAIANSTPTTSAVGDAAAIGSGNVLARSTHVHGREGFATPVAVGVANAAGAATTLARSNHVHLACGTIGYAEKTANQTGISSATDLTSLSVASTVVSGRRVRVTGQVLVSASTDGVHIRMQIKEGSTILQVGDCSIGGALRGDTIRASVILTPSAGSHTYKLTLAVQNGAGTVDLIAASDSPSFILVEDIGV